MKKWVSRLTLVVLISLFIFIGFQDYSKEVNHKNDSKNISLIYNSLNQNNNYEIFTKKELLSFLDKGTGAILLCFKSNASCNTFVSLVDEVARAEKKTIYYFDILRDRSENTYYYQEMIKKFKDFLYRDDLEETFIITPVIFFLKNGVVINASEMGTFLKGKEEINDFWTNEKMIEFKEIIKTNLEKVG